jgi:hypothetical protein
MATIVSSLPEAIRIASFRPREARWNSGEAAAGSRACQKNLFEMSENSKAELHSRRGAQLVRTSPRGAQQQQQFGDDCILYIVWNPLRISQFDAACVGN